MRGSKSLGRPASKDARVGAIGEASKLMGLNRNEMIIAPKLAPSTEMAVGDVAKRRPTCTLGKANAPAEESSRRTLEAAGVGIQARWERLAEIESGRAIAQQGLAATCKARTQEGNQRRPECNGLAHESVGAMKAG